MSAYYNEFDPFAAAWLRELIAAGAIAPGDVDERSITEVTAADLAGYTQCHFFAGIGGWSHALRLAGWADARPVWTGSCPCQPFSAAGKGKGGTDDRHLWPHWSRLIRECRPVTVFGEQVESAIGHGWLDLVSDDLEREGYAIGPVCVPAASVGAPHRRQRLWFVADAHDDGHDRRVAGTLGRTQQHSQSQESKFRRGAETVIYSGAPSDVADARRDQSIGTSTASRAPRWGATESSVFGPVGLVADNSSGGQRINRSASGQARHVDECQSVDLVGNADLARLETCDRESVRTQPRSCESANTSASFIVADTKRDEKYQEQQRPASDEGEGGADGISGCSLDGPWNDLLWLPCRDGKSRPTQPGLFPLVAGVSGGVVPSGDPSEADADASTEARVGRLRGYGNAIVPQVAAEVIRAYMEVA